MTHNMAADLMVRGASKPGVRGDLKRRRSTHLAEMHAYTRPLSEAHERYALSPRANTWRNV